MRLLAHDFEKARDVPTLRNPLLGLDADQPGQGWIATKFSQASLKGRVAQGNGQHHDAPEHTDRIVIASPAPGDVQALQ